MLIHSALARPAGGQAPARAGTPPRTIGIPRERLDEITRFVRRARTRLGLPGVAVSVATGDSVLLAIGAGAGTRTGAPLDGHTPFLIGSVTKTFTATAVARLAASGRVDLDAPVESTLPDFTLRSPFEWGSITARHLLTHRSGLRQWSGHDRRAQRDGQFSHLAPAHPAGEHPEYSSLNFIILGRIVEAASGESYAHYVEENLLHPLEMSDAFIAGPDTWPSNAAAGHQSYFGVQIGRREPLPPRFLVPAGFAAASANDLARFGGMLVGRGSFAGERVLDEQTVDELLGPLDTAGLALAWGRRRADGVLILEHAGNARTSSARVRLVPQRGYTISVLANTNSGPFFSATADLMNGVNAILEGEPTPTVWPRERIFKGVLLLGTAFSIVQFARRARDWQHAGRPTRFTASRQTITPLVVDVVGGSLLLFALPRYLGVPLSTMTEYFPDLGIALIGSAGAGIAGGVLRAWTRSVPAAQ